MAAIFIAGVTATLVGATIYAVALAVLNGFPPNGKGF